MNENIAAALDKLKSVAPETDWDNVRTTLNTLGNTIYGFNKAKGFWDAPVEIAKLEEAFNNVETSLSESQATALNSVIEKFSRRNVGELLMLKASELGEAMEADRKNMMDNHLPHLKGFDTEVADCLIRIMDASGGLNLNIGDVVIEKLAYNLSRPHKHGKNY